MAWRGRHGPSCSPRSSLAGSHCERTQPDSPCLVSFVAEYAETYVWPMAAVSTITRLWLLNVPLTLGIVVLAVLAWKDRYWGVAGRVHYTLLALAGALFVLFLGYWNLIGL